MDLGALREFLARDTEKLAQIRAWLCAPAARRSPLRLPVTEYAR